MGGSSFLLSPEACPLLRRRSSLTSQDWSRPVTSWVDGPMGRCWSIVKTCRPGSRQTSFTHCVWCVRKAKRESCLLHRCVSSMGRFHHPQTIWTRKSFEQRRSTIDARSEGFACDRLERPTWSMKQDLEETSFKKFFFQHPHPKDFQDQRDHKHMSHIFSLKKLPGPPKGCLLVGFM